MPTVDGSRLTVSKNFKTALRKSNEVIKKRWKKDGYESVTGLETL